MSTATAVTATIREPSSHSCEVCQSREYTTAEIIIKRRGLRPQNLALLAHDIAEVLRGGLKEIQWEVTDKHGPAPSVKDWWEETRGDVMLDHAGYLLAEEAWSASRSWRSESQTKE